MREAVFYVVGFWLFMTVAAALSNGLAGWYFWRIRDDHGRHEPLCYRLSFLLWLWAIEAAHAVFTLGSGWNLGTARPAWHTILIRIAIRTAQSLIAAWLILYLHGYWRPSQPPRIVPPPEV